MAFNDYSWQWSKGLPCKVGRQAGFSLLELMIAVAVIAILASIAYPNYREHVIKSRRAAVTACLQQHAQLMERHYTTNLTYVGAAAPTCDGSVASFYTVDFSAAPAARTYTIRAAPTSRQPDSRCGTLTLNSQGVRTKSGSGALADCW